MSDYTPIEQKFTVHAIYCEAQGRFAMPAEDHVRSLPMQNFEEQGEPDQYGGRKLVTIRGGANDALGVSPGATIMCRVCGAPLRRVELRDVGKPV